MIHMKTITVLGSTGSIGTQALEVANKHNIKISNNIITASKSLIDYTFNTNGELLYIVKKSATLDTEVLIKASAL